MIYWGHRLGSLVCPRLPVWLCYAIASLVSPMVFYVWKAKRENAIRNMAQVLGPGADPVEARKLALRSFVNYGKYMVDMLRGEGRLRDAERGLVVEGWEHFLEVQQKGKGLIFVGAHIGNWDLAAALLARRGFPVYVIAEPLHPPRWDALVQRARAAIGIGVIPMGQALLRSLRLLRDGQILAFLVDRPLEDQGVVVEFFGQQTRVPGGAAALALRSGAGVLGTYIVRAGNAYVAGISSEISVPATGNSRDDLQALTQRIFTWLEQVIRQHPDQWFMFRAMWPADTQPLARSQGGGAASLP